MIVFKENPWEDINQDKVLQIKKSVVNLLYIVYNDFGITLTEISYKYIPI